MKPKYITIDGMIGGTGIRDSVAGGYLEPKELDLSNEIILQIEVWLQKYEHAHYLGFNDPTIVQLLDEEGMVIMRQIQSELPETKVQYYSHARNCDLNRPGFAGDF